MIRLNICLSIIGAAFFMLMAGGCVSTSSTTGPSGSASDSDPNTVAVTNPSLSLENYIRQLPGVFVDNQGDGVLIRGVSSLSSDTHALFVIDGIRVGRTLSGVRARINMNEVSTIRVVKSGSMYGVEGGNGVIEIETL